VIVYAFILRNIMLYNYKLNNFKIPKEYFSKINTKVDYSVLKSFISNNFNNSNIRIIEIENLKLNLQFGTQNVIVTSGLVTTFNILIPIILSKLIDNYSNQKYNYEIKPIYENKNKIDLFLETTIKIKLFSIIKALKNYKKARKPTYRNKKSTIQKNPINIAV